MCSRLLPSGAHMQDINSSIDLLRPGAILLLRHIFEVACDAVENRVTESSKARIHGVIGLAIVDAARAGEVDPDHLLKHALACARAALN